MIGKCRYSFIHSKQNAHLQTLELGTKLHQILRKFLRVLLTKWNRYKEVQPQMGSLRTYFDTQRKMKEGTGRKKRYYTHFTKKMLFNRYFLFWSVKCNIIFSDGFITDPHIWKYPFSHLDKNVLYCNNTYVHFSWYVHPHFRRKWKITEKGDF